VRAFHRLHRCISSQSLHTRLARQFCKTHNGLEPSRSFVPCSSSKPATVAFSDTHRAVPTFVRIASCELSCTISRALYRGSTRSTALTISGPLRSARLLASSHFDSSLTIRGAALCIAHHTFHSFSSLEQTSTVEDECLVAGISAVPATKHYNRSSYRNAAIAVQASSRGLARCS